MKKYTLELGEVPKIEIESIGGDLRLSGHDESYLEIQAPESGDLKVTEDDGGVVISCRSGCLVFVPRKCMVEGDTVGGDCRITDLEGEVLLQTIGGDLSLRRLGKVSLELVGGDLQARRLSSDLAVDRVGGDVIVHELTGMVRLRMVGGDIVLRDISGAVEANCGGDALISFDPATGTKSRITTGSDIECRLSPEASVNISLQVGGDTDISRGFEQGSDPGSYLLGAGESELELCSGGDLGLRVGDERRERSGFNFADVLTEVDADLAEMEAKFDALGAGLIGFDADQVGERVRRAVRRARRSASKARRQHVAFAENMDLASDLADLTAPFGGLGQAANQVSDEERLSVLRMVEQGTISVDEAESLLKALEGEA